jgi:hypothetical protein
MFILEYSRAPLNLKDHSIQSAPKFLTRNNDPISHGNFNFEGKSFRLVLVLSERSQKRCLLFYLFTSTSDNCFRQLNRLVYILFKGEAEIKGPVLEQNFVWTSRVPHLNILISHRNKQNFIVCFDNCRLQTEFLFFSCQYSTTWRSRYSDWLLDGRQWSRSSGPGRVKNFHFSILSRPALGPTQPPIQLVPGEGAPSPAVERPEREADHSSPTSAEDKKTHTHIYIYIYIHLLTIRLHGVLIN